MLTYCCFRPLQHAMPAAGPRKRRRGCWPVVLLPWTMLWSSTMTSVQGYKLLLHRQLPHDRVCPYRCASRQLSTISMVNAEQLGLRHKDPEFQFFDQAQVFVKGGSGGHPAATFKMMNGRQRGMPDGGSGGRGGDVVLVCDGKLNTLQSFRGRASFHAENGKDGAAQFRNGGNGPSVFVKVAPGTIVYEKDTRRVVGELKEDGEEMVVAKGGEGGMGNAAAKPVRGQRAKGSPPQGGTKRWLELELKLVADVGLVGVPNAGKSTLLAAVSNARPKIADYPFTTVVPNLGVVDGESLGLAQGRGLVISDVPGLLEGAHRGLGLGRAFLKHIERCRLIIHVVDGTGQDPLGDFDAINMELALFNPGLARKPQVVVLNKVDIPSVREAAPRLKEELLARMGHTRLMEISAATRENTRELMGRVAKLIGKLEAAEKAKAAALEAEGVSGEGESLFETGGRSRERLVVEELGEGEWRVCGHVGLEAMAEGLLEKEHYEADVRLNEALAAVGAVDALLRQGAKPMDRVWIGAQVARHVLLQPPPPSTEEPLESRKDTSVGA